MRIAQYYPWVYLKSGIERTIIEMVKRSRHEHTVLTNHYAPEATFPDFAGARVVALDQISVKRSLNVVAGAAGTIARSKVDLSGYDALMVHCDGLGDLFMLRNNSVPSFCFCHTPLRPCFDTEYFRRVAPRYPGWKQAPLRLARAGFRAIDRQLWRRYRYVFFNSAETLRRASRGGLLAALDGRYEIAHPGMDVQATPVSDVFEPFFLLPGRIMWTKNIEAAVAGFVAMKNARPEFAAFRLVVAGHVDAKSESYLGDLRRLAAGRDDVDFVVSPDDATLGDLYRRCYASLFSAWNEDWGMAPLEANAAGKPVVASRRGGPLESQVDGVTGFLVDATPAGFAAGMARLAASPERTRAMGAMARTRCEQYDWSVMVDRIDSVIEQRCGVGARVMAASAAAGAGAWQGTVAGGE